MDRTEVLIARLRRLLDEGSRNLGWFTWSSLLRDTIAELERISERVG